MSLLSVIDACDNFRIESTSEPISPLYIHVPPKPGDAIIGSLRPSVLSELEKYNRLLVSKGDYPIWEIVYNDSDTSDRLNNPTNSGRPGRFGVKWVGFVGRLDTPIRRSEAIGQMCEKWSRDGTPFGDIIGGRMWRNELYPVYANPFVLDEKTILFQVERAAASLFGIVTYGVHMTMYTQDYRIWIATRSMTKQTYGGMLDNTVAGGIPLGYTPWDSMVKECMEEGSLSEEVVVPNLRPAGAISYFYQTKKGWLQPEVQFVYDLPVPAGKEEASEYIPKPLDGEVECFELLSLPIVRERMLAGAFKPNCALLVIDFMIRHGKLNASNEPYLLEILSRLHGTFGYTK